MKLCAALLAFGLVAMGLPQAGYARERVAGLIDVENPTITPTLGLSNLNSGYFDLENHGRQADRLLAVESGDAKRIEIHMHEMADGIMRMRKVDGGVVLAPGARVRFAPGGLHLMVFDAAKGLVVGDSFEMVLVFEKAGRIAVTATCARLVPGADRPH